MDASRPPDQHRRYEEMAVAHVLGGLDESEGKMFRNHLLGCLDCRARVGELRAMAHDLADVERAERRMREVHSVDTKRRDGREDGRRYRRDGGPDVEDEDHPRTTGRPRIATVLSVAAILALMAWNFTLRETVDRYDSDLARSGDASAALEFGEPGEVLVQARGVRGVVKTDRNALVVLIDGLDNEQRYGLYLLDNDGRTLFRAAVQPTSGRLFSLVDYPPDAVRVILTRPEQSPTADPEGTTIFSARLATP